MDGIVGATRISTRSVTALTLWHRPEEQERLTATAFLDSIGAPDARRNS
jgi:hypothetical protein